MICGVGRGVNSAIVPCRARRAARYRQTAPYTFEVERALNWQALEPDARAAAQAQVGVLTTHEHLPCPKELAERARWK